MSMSRSVEKLYNIADNYHASRLHSFYKSQEIDAIIDIGSHKGEFITKVVRDKKVPIFSFEPQKRVREDLKKNTESYNVQSYYDFAVSDFNGEIDLCLNSLTSTTSLFKSNEDSSWIKFKKILLGNKLYDGAQKAKVRELDSVLLNNTLSKFRCILLKIDVEGAEASVLRGAKKLIREYNIEYVQIENASFNIYKKNLSHNPSYYLNEYGYNVEKKFLFPFMNFSDVVFKRRVACN